MNLLTIVILIVLALSEILFAIGLFKMMDGVRRLKKDIDDYWEILKSVQKIDNGREQTYSRMLELQELFNKQYHKLIEQYERFYDCYKEISEHYTAILEVWAGIDQKYDQTFEQFKYTADTLKLISEKIDQMRNKLPAYFEEGIWIEGIEEHDENEEAIKVRLTLEKPPARPSEDDENTDILEDDESEEK